MSDVTALAQAFGFVIQTIGLLTVAIKTGSWKGVTDNRVKDLEVRVSDLRVEVNALDKRVDGMQMEFSKALARIETNLEFIKAAVSERKKGV